MDARLIVNGSPRALEGNTTVAELLDQIGARAERVAVELNLRILDREDFKRTLLKDGDRLEIISFVGGGDIHEG